MLGLDVGGANLKAADGCEFARTRPFALWKTPQQLTAELVDLIRAAPATTDLAVTMTGELADCFRFKAEGVAHILESVERAAGERRVRVYLTTGQLVTTDVARSQPLLAAASNWHALARFCARFVGAGVGLLVDIGSTTTDLIPIVDGLPAAVGKTDPERLASGELVYTGVQRSPICAITSSLPWHGQKVATAQEMFATAWDAYLLLDELPEEPASLHTADGRPASKEWARARLARMICADESMFSDQDARQSALAIEQAQLARLGVAAQSVLRRLPSTAGKAILGGQGEFLGRKLVERLRPAMEAVSLSAELGPEISRCATAHAVAVLARENP